MGIKKNKWFFLIWMMIFSTPGFAEARGGWAVIVGIDTYHSPEISSLSGAVNDVESMSKTLPVVFDMPADHVLVYTSKDPSRIPTTGRIVKALKYVAKKAGKEDLFVFSFSGHGISSNRKSYLLTYYSEMGALIDTALSIERVSELIGQIPASKKLLILDACRNDPSKGRGGAPNVLTGDFARGIVVTPGNADVRGSCRESATLFSCEVGQRAYEWPEKNRGYFSYFLEQGLNGKAADDSGAVTLGSLVGYLRHAVPDTLQRTQGIDRVQQPYVVMEGGDPASWVLTEIGKKDWAAEVTRRQTELSRLDQLASAQKIADQRRKAEEEAYQQKLAAMDQQIIKMKKRLGTSSARSGDNLDTMLAMIDQKEAEQQKMAALKQQREAEEKKRQSEMKRLQAEKNQKIRTSFEEDAEKYKKIMASPYGRDMGAVAWQQLVQKYPEAAKGISTGDIEKMKSVFYKLAPLINDLGMAFVYIEPGTFMMGSPSNEKNRDDDETQHRVTLTKGYYLQTTEVTQGQWKAIMGNNPSNFKNCGDDCPVENVSWNDVQEFIKKVNQREGINVYRLPTEAEWEYACRAGSTTSYCFGNRSDGLEAYAWYTSNSGGKPHPKVQKQPNAWGLYDMYGNVWEWCADWYGDYPSGSVTDSKGPSSGKSRVSRGGSWNSLARFCRSAFRGRDFPGNRSSILGFRLARLPGQ